MFDWLKMGCHNHTVGVGIGGNGKGQAGAGSHRTQRSRPVSELPPLVGNRRYGRAGTAFLDLLAGSAGYLAAARGHKLHRNPGAAHRDGIGGDQPQRHPVRLRNGCGGGGPPVLGDVSVGAHIGKVFRHSLFGEVYPIGKGVIFFGPAGGAVPQHLGAVQKFVAFLLTHGNQGVVVGVHLGHGQVGVVSLLVQGGDGAHNDVGIGPRRHDGRQSLPVFGDKTGGVCGGPTQIVGAKPDDDSPWPQFGHCLRNGIKAAVPLELFAFQRWDGSGPHADHTNVVFERGKCGAGVVGVHGVADRVGIPNEQGFVQIAPSRVRRLNQNGAVLARSRLCGGFSGGLRCRTDADGCRFRGGCGGGLCLIDAGTSAQQAGSRQYQHQSRSSVKI